MQADGKVPSLLVGHSLGGAAVLAAAGAMPDVRAVVTIAAPFDVAHVLHQMDPAALERIEAQGEAEVLLAGRPFVVRRSFVDDLRQHDQGARIAARTPASCNACAGRHHRGHRQRQPHLHGGEASEELRLAR